ncbi:MAG: NfeD family protein [Lachnospiraceae bacterium]
MDTVIIVISWLLLAAIFIVIEIITLGLTTIWFAGGAFVAAIAAVAGVSLPIQVILFVVVSVALLILTRPLAVKHLDSKTEKTNAEGLVGQTAVVLSEINNLKETGQAKINGMEWTARAKNNEEVIPIDEAVRVVDIQGVKLIVERITPSESKEEAKIELDDDVIKTV